MFTVAASLAWWGTAGLADARRLGWEAPSWSLLNFRLLISLPCNPQALANNLLGRAVQLSRHAALGPDAVVCCALAVAELQLQQARAMLAKGGPMCSLAVALLSTSYQQLTGADLEAAAASSAARAAGLLDAKKQVGQ